MNRFRNFSDKDLCKSFQLQV